MADRKITQLSAQTSTVGTDLMELVRSGENYKITLANLIASVVADVDDAIADHLADTADAHDASAVSVLDTDGNFTGTQVEDVLAELFGAIGGGGGGGGGLFDAYAVVREQQAASTEGGTFTTGAWRTRTLNTEASDPDGIVSLASDQITLAAGTYFVRARAPAFNCGHHKVRLRNVTDGTTLLVGEASYASANVTHAEVIGRFTLAATKAIELQHRCQNTVATAGLGGANQFDEVEVYAEVEIWREGTISGGGSGLFDAYAIIRDEKSAGTDGGTFTSGAWRTRDLNTEQADVGGIVSISSNQFTLAAGSYLIKASIPAHGCDNIKAKLRNITDSTDALVSDSSFAYSGQSVNQPNLMVGRITIAGTKTFEIQQRCASTKATNGMGVNSNMGVTEVYTQVEIWRET